MFAARLRAYAPGGASLGLLPDPLSWQASVVHGDLGALTVTYSTLSAGGALIGRPLADGLEVAVEVWDGTTWVEPRGCRFVRVAQGADTADDMQVYSVTFRAWGWLLSKARLTAGTFTDGRRYFVAPLAGDLVGDILAENASIGGVPVTVVGGTTTDAAGASWPVLPDQNFGYADDYLGIVRGLQEAGALDWATQARGLYLYLPDSTALSPDLSATVRLRLGLDIGQAPADETIESLVSQIAVRAQAGGTVVVDEPTAPVPWGEWQGSLAVGQVDSEAAATAMGEAELERTGRAREQYTRDLILHDGAPIPLVAYGPGAWITAPTSVAAESVRVQQVTLTFGADGYSGNVVLNDRLVESDIRRARTLATLAGGQVGSGGAPLPIAFDPEASRVPSTPTGLDSTAALTFTGPTPRGVVTATWNAVTTATDSGTLDISGYELQWRIGAGAWQTILTPELSAQIANQTPGDSIDTRVRAISPVTVLPSAWSATDNVVVPGDVTAPSVPTAPTVTSSLMIMSVLWDGALTSGIPADFAYVEVAAGTSATPTNVRGRLLRGGTLQITAATLGVAIGTTVYARLRSVDTTGNTSSYSSAVSVVMTGVVGPDLAANSVTANTIAAGAIDGKLITGATIRSSATNPRAEMDSTGFHAYNASGVETVSILGSSSTITAATVRSSATNPRVEMNSSGFFAYDSGGTATISISGGSSTITGATVRTAASGDRLEMTTAGLKAWKSSVAVAELLPAGMYLRAGGELIVEYADASPALRVGRLTTGTYDTYGVEMYNLSGTDVFSLYTRSDTSDVKLIMDGLETWTVFATTTSITAPSSFQVMGGGVGAAGTDYSLLQMSALGLTLKMDANDTADETILDFSTTQVTVTTGTASGFRHLTTNPFAGLTTAGSSGNYTFIANDRGVYIGHLTTGSTANAFISSTDGKVSRVTSSLRYKQDVEDLDLTVEQVLQLRPVTWRDRNEVAENPDTTQRYPGWIAEEVHAIGDGALDVFVVFDELDRPDALQGDRLSAAQQIVLIDHEARLTDALDRIAALEAA